MPAVIKSTEAAGVAVVDEELFRQRRSVALAIDYPLGEEAGKAAAAELCKKFKPAAMIFIEKVGPNRKGIYHSIMGTPRTPDKIASAYHLADFAKANGIATIGVGDGGNEIGCGVIKEAVAELQPLRQGLRLPLPWRRWHGY